MPRRVRKTIIELTVLSEVGDRPATWDLEAIVEAINTGPCLGDWKATQETIIPAEKVEAECQALHNDGSFFSGDDEDD